MSKLILRHLFITLVIVFMFPVSSFSGDTNDDYGYPLYGAGSMSCGKWLEEGKDLSNLPYMKTWIAGYVTAAGVYLGFYQKSMLRSSDTEAMILHINNYCQSHPLTDIWLAADNLVIALTIHK